MNTITRLELLKRLAAVAKLPISLEGNIFDTFDKAGLLRKFRRNSENLPEAAATRAFRSHAATISSAERC